MTAHLTSARRLLQRVLQVVSLFSSARLAQASSEFPEQCALAARMVAYEPLF
jgi:hypothetical protein